MKLKRLKQGLGMSSIALLLSACTFNTKTTRTSTNTQTTSVADTTSIAETTTEDINSNITTTDLFTTTEALTSTAPVTTTYVTTTGEVITTTEAISTSVETTTAETTTIDNTTTVDNTTTANTTTVDTTTAANTTTEPVTTTVETTTEEETTTSPQTTTLNTTTADITTTFPYTSTNIATTTAIEVSTSNTTTYNSTTNTSSNVETTSEDLTTTESGTIDNMGSLTILTSKSYSEGAYIEAQLINGTDASDYTAYYKKTTDSTFVAIDSELVRVKNNKLRVDYLGLTEGSYDFKLEYNGNSSSYSTVSNVEVLEYDRSGYAHFYNSGIGAYNDDGSLKTDTVVVYVSDATKNTVTATIAGTTYTGLSNIIKAQKDSKVPLDIRILDEIQAQQWAYINDKSVYGTASTKARNANLDLAFSEVDWEDTSTRQDASSNYYKIGEDDIIAYGINELTDTGVKYDQDGNATTITGITHLDGLTNIINYSKNVDSKTGVQEYDSYYNELDVRGASNLTIEGIGEDAGIFQWGFCFNQCNSIEVRNLEFSSYTEDAIGIQGSKATNMDYHGYWIHHNTFNQGVNNWDVTYESDKHEGDGSTDFKFAYDLTISYCRYNMTHKTALIGSGSSSYQYNVTFHHNYYYKCGSRLPFTRNTNFHIYNCYYYASTGTNMQINDTAYAFIEGCYFENTNKTFTTSKGVIKLWNNIVNSTSSTAASSTIVYADSRTQAVTNSCQDKSSGYSWSGTDYSSFDTDKTLFYYDSTNQRTKVTRMDEASNVPAVVKEYAGSGCKAGVQDYYLGGEIIDDTTDDPIVDDPVIDDPVVEDPIVDTDYTTVEEASLTEENTTSLSNETYGENPGVYWYTNAEDSTNNYLTYNNGKMTLVDTSSEARTTAFYKYENTYNSGVVKYTVTLTPSTNSGSWTLAEFYDGNNNIIIRTDGSKYISYSIDGATTLNNILTSKMVANSTYVVTIIIDYDNGTVKIDVNGTSVEFNYQAGEIVAVKFMTAKAERNLTVSDITVATKNN